MNSTIIAHILRLIAKGYKWLSERWSHTSANRASQAAYAAVQAELTRDKAAEAFADYRDAKRLAIEEKQAKEERRADELYDHARDIKRSALFAATNIQKQALAIERDAQRNTDVAMAKLHSETL